jgi:hypothetical protein
MAFVLSTVAVAQNECINAVAVNYGANGPFTNVGSTTSAPAWPCAAGGNDVWYSYTAGFTGTVFVQTCGANYDSAIQIFTGGCGALVSVACNDDFCGLQSRLTLNQTASTTYYIRVGGYFGATGTFPLDIFQDGEECSGAGVLVNGPNGPFSNVGYTTSAPAWPCAAGGSDRWFSYTATCSGSVTVDTCGSGYDTCLQAFDACGGTSLACDDDGCGYPSSRIVFPVVQNNVYKIRLGGYAGFQGTTGINVTCTPSGVPNDECINAIALVAGPNGPFSNVGSSTSAPGWPCGAGGNDVWFSYVSPCCGTLTVDTCGSGYDTVLQLFSSCGGLSLGCDDDGCGYPSSRVSCPVGVNTTVLIRMGGFAGLTGSSVINVNCTPSAPVNDDCANAIPVYLGSNGLFSNFCANTSFAWPCAAGGSDVWFTFQANCSCPTTFQTCGSSYDTAIEVFDGTFGCGGLVSLGCNDDNFTGGPCYSTLQSWLTVPLNTGTTYYVRVGGFANRQGYFVLNISQGTGLGSIAMTTPSLCTVGALALSVTGDPNIGGTVTSSVSGTTGLPFVTWGFVPAPLLAPFCPCQILSVSTSWLFAPSISLTIPCFSGFIGLPLQTQGADLFGFPAACGTPVPNAFTDVWTVTIG